MVGYLFKISEEELAEILSDSSLLDAKVFPEDDSVPSGRIDVDKAWEAIFFVLTGYGSEEIDEVSPPMAWLLESESVVDENRDMGYGPANYIKPSQVKLLNAELEKVSVDDFKDRFDGEQMDEAGIYPEIWQEDDALDYACENFMSLKEFYASAAAENKAVITFIA